MTQKPWRAVSVNLGGASPGALVDPERADEWAKAAVQPQYDVVFAQEVPNDEWLGIWEANGYRVVEYDGKPYRTRSALIVRSGIGVVKDGWDFPTRGYHGSYVAAAMLHHPPLGPVVLMSVHASPNPVSEDWESLWRNTGHSLPPEYRGRLWDSDLVVESVRLVAESAGGVPVIAAGDWNEARNWDRDHAGGSGAAFFKHLGARGLIDACCPNGIDAQPTHGSDGRALRLHHIVTTKNIPFAVDIEPPTGEAWPADHRPVEFTIG
jgi:hypothetical protein